MTDPNVDKDGPSRGTSSSLLERVRAQDRAAWERLVSLYGPLVYGWCRRTGLRSQDAEDVGQEVFAAVHRKVAVFRRDRQGDSFRGWLRTITMNKIRDLARRRRTQAEGDAGETQQRLVESAAQPEDDSDARADPTETVVLAHRALDLLRDEFTKEKWHVFHRVVVEGEAPADVATALGISVNTVYLTKSRGLRRLREEFAGLLDLDEVHS